jgi:hypothetical protein
LHLCLWADGSWKVSWRWLKEGLKVCGRKWIYWNSLEVLVTSQKCTWKSSRLPESLEVF